MDKELDTATGDYTGKTINTLKNAVYIRLMTPLGSWWADKTVGSQLHLLQREKDIAKVSLLAEQYAREALEPIVKSGRAERITVTAEQPKNGRLYLHIRVETAAGGFDYRHGVSVI
ncbi:phage GP46 family protein [Neisseria sp. S1]|uniref:phage GP46 family protein n=1 Tax=Neisseria sp. S1 TaxID=3318354 RepID=UPI003A8589D1